MVALVFMFPPSTLRHDLTDEGAVREVRAYSRGRAPYSFTSQLSSAIHHTKV